MTVSRPRPRGCRAAEEEHELVERAQLGVVVLELARGDVAEALDLDLVDDRVEDVRARAEALAGEHLQAQPLRYLALLSPRRIVTVLRRLRSWSATSGL